MRRKYSDLEALKRKLGGANKPPERAPAKEISHHHSNPPSKPSPPSKPAKRNSVDGDGEPHADTVLSHPPEIVDQNGTMAASPKGKKKNGSKKPKAKKSTTLILKKNDVVRLHLFHYRREQLKKVISQLRGELRNNRVKRVHVELRLFEMKFSILSITSDSTKSTEAAKKILLDPLNKKLEELAPDVKGDDFEKLRRIADDPDSIKDGSPFRDSFSIDLVRPTDLEVPKVQKPISEEMPPEPALVESEMAVELDIETAQILPDETKSFFFALSNSQGYSEFYLVRRINEDSLGFFKMDPKTNEIIDDGKIELKLDRLEKNDNQSAPIVFGHEPYEKFRVVISNFMDGTPAFMIKRWESTAEYPVIHEPIGYGQEIATGIVAAVAVASIPLLPTIAKFMSNYTSVMSFPETVNLSMPIFGKLSLSLNAFLGWSAATLAALESAIIGLGIVGRDKQKPR